MCFCIRLKKSSEEHNKSTINFPFIEKHLSRIILSPGTGSAISVLNKSNIWLIYLSIGSISPRFDS